MRILRVFLYGYSTLILAIFANVLMKDNGFYTWYDLMSITDFTIISIPNLFILLVVYPFILGISLFIVDRIWKK